MDIHLRARQILRFSNAYNGRNNGDSNNLKMKKKNTPAVAAALAKLSCRDLKLARAVVDIYGGSGEAGGEVAPADGVEEKGNKWPAKWEEEAPGVSAKSMSMSLMHWRQACFDAGIVVSAESETGSKKDDGKGKGDEKEDEEEAEEEEEEEEVNGEDTGRSKVDGQKEKKHDTPSVSHVRSQRRNVQAPPSPESHGRYTNQAPVQDDDDDNFPLPLRPLLDSAPGVRVVTVTKELLIWCIMPAALVMLGVAWGWYMFAMPLAGDYLPR